MNNAINEIKKRKKKKTLWMETNSRITVAEDRVSEVEDRTVEINETGGKKKKRIKINENNIRDLWDNVKHPNIRITEVPEDKRKGHEKILEEIIIENFPKMGKEIATQVQQTQSPKQDKPTVKQPKTHINQTNEDQTQRKNIKSSKGEATSNMQGKPHMLNR